MMVGADQHQVGELGLATVFPVPDVMGMQPPGRPTAGNHAAAVAVLKGAAQPTVDCAGGATGADDLTVALEPHLKAGVAQQVLAFVIGEQRT